MKRTGEQGMESKYTTRPPKFPKSIYQAGMSRKSLNFEDNSNPFRLRVESSLPQHQECMDQGMCSCNFEGDDEEIKTLHRQFKMLNDPCFDYNF